MSNFLVVNDENWDEYLARMRRGGQWGSHVELHAAANLLGTPILVTTDSGGVDNFQIWIYPKETRSTDVLLLGFHSELHYYSLEGALIVYLQLH